MQAGKEQLAGRAGQRQGRRADKTDRRGTCVRTLCMVNIKTCT
jgi:hypothetical protein